MPVKRVAFLIPNLQGGGAERVFATLLRCLDRSLYEPLLVLGKLEGAYVSDIPSDVRPVELGGLRARHVLRALPRWVRAARPDLVIATTGFAAAAAFTRPMWPARTALVTRLANTLSSFYKDVARRSGRSATAYRWINRGLYLGSDRVICQSDHMLDDARREIALGASKLHRIYNPVDLEAIRALSLQPAPPLPGVGPKLVAVGNLRWQKGYDVLLRAFAKLRGRWTTSTLSIFGEGGEREQLEKLAAQLHLGGALDLHGFAGNPYPALRSADLLVSSSRYEGFSNVIVEALALGTPVVATDCPSANREVIRPQSGARLAPVDDPEGLARELDFALSNLEQLRIAVPDLHIAERFGSATIVGEYEALFSHLMRSGATVPD